MNTGGIPVSKGLSQLASMMCRSFHPPRCSDKNLLDSETLSSADGQGSAGPGGAPSPGPPTAGGSEAPLPDGQVAVVVSFGSSAAKCLDYAPNSADTWVNDTMPAWRGTGNETPDVLDVQASPRIAGRPCLWPAWLRRASVAGPVGSTGWTPGSGTAG